MKKIRVTCESHGDISVSPSDVLLTLFDHPVGDPYYTFTCPECDGCYQKAASPATVSLLLSVVEYVIIHVPLELTEDHTGPTISEADIDDFCIELYRNAHFRVPGASESP